MVSITVQCRMKLVSIDGRLYEYVLVPSHVLMALAGARTIFKAMVRLCDLDSNFVCTIKSLIHVTYHS